jgi:hypothetical protein
MPMRMPMFVRFTDDGDYYNPPVTGEVRQVGPGRAEWDPRYATPSSYVIPTYNPQQLRPPHRAPITRPHAMLAPRRRESRQTRRVRTTRARASARGSGSKAGDEPHPGRPRAGARSEVLSGSRGAR